MKKEKISDKLNNMEYSKYFTHKEDKRNRSNISHLVMTTCRNSSKEFKHFRHKDEKQSMAFLCQHIVVDI